MQTERFVDRSWVCVLECRISSNVPRERCGSVSSGNDASMLKCDAVKARHGSKLKWSRSHARAAVARGGISLWKEFHVKFEVRMLKHIFFSAFINPSDWVCFRFNFPTSPRAITVSI